MCNVPYSIHYSVARLSFFLRDLEVDPDPMGLTPALDTLAGLMPAADIRAPWVESSLYPRSSRVAAAYPEPP